jgi:hypothetical protein
MSAAAAWSLFSKLARASKLLSAVTDFLMYLAAVMRQLVQVAGGIVLLAECVALLISPHLTIGRLAMPGVGALAVLQSLVKPWWHRELPPGDPPSDGP